jgi:protein-S-isoprenylcysteine O-methyltransferase Ste14
MLSEGGEYFNFLIWISLPTATMSSKKSAATDPLTGLVDFVFQDNSKLHNWYNFPISVTVDVFKGLTPFVILLMMFLHRGEPYNALSNPVAWAYFGTHGSYGVLWASKNLFGFGDFHQVGSLVAHILTAGLLIIYWIPIYLICSRTTPAPVWIIGPGVFLYGYGVFWHFVADMHKTVFLEFRAKVKKELGENHKLVDNLLQTKLWKHSRNPNYFGEMCIYGSFCVLSYHWLPFVAFGSIMVIMWGKLMQKKDASLSRFGKEFEDYKKTSNFFLPKFN